ncbi:MAG: hypothetical protein L6R35_003998 [Caloplaca aegaea]|nr:MAG: hypothetical protein L6R35_003998 [Caloplaca aegaea]
MVCSPDGLENKPLQPTPAERDATFSSASRYWGHEADASVLELKSGLNLKRFDIRHMLGRVPPIPDRARYGLLKPSPLASTWRVTGSEDCEVDGKPVQIPPVQLRLFISTPTKVTLDGNSFRKWIEFDGDDQPNFLAIITLAWSYILSARLVELQGRDGSMITYTETTAPLCRGDERLSSFPVDVGNVDSRKIRWFAAILAPGSGFQVISHQEDGHSYHSPWAFSLATQKSYFHIRPGNDYQDLEVSGRTPLNSYEALHSLVDFCNREGVSNHQLHAAFATALLFPTHNYLNVHPALPHPTAGNPSSSSTKPSCEDADQLYNDLPYYITLGCGGDIINSTLCGVFWNPQVPSNLASPWLQPLMDLKGMKSMQSTPGCYAEVLAMICARRAPNVAFLSIGAATSGLTSTILEQVKTGQPPLERHAYAWTGVPQSFMDFAGEGKYYETHCSQTNECTLEDNLGRDMLIPHIFNNDLPPQEADFFRDLRFSDNEDTSVDATITSFRWVLDNGEGRPPEDAYKDQWLHSIDDADSDGDTTSLTFSKPSEILDVQLKVLQALPLLLQNYAAALRGRLLISAVQVCFLLQGSKTVVVSNTAAASLQQFLAFAYERLAAPTESAPPDDSLQSVPTRNGSVSVSGAAADAYHILYDVCLLAEGKEPHVLHGARLDPAFGLQLIESSLASHIDTIANREELIHVCRTRLMPLIIGILSNNATFALTVRAMRLLSLFTSKLLSAMVTELEVAFNQLSFVLDPLASSKWRRALGLELYREIHDDPAQTREMYARYDQVQENKNIISDQLDLLVRLASEKPAIIGLGQQLSQESRTEAYQDLPLESIAIESGGIAGAITAPTHEMNQNGTGLSSQWSSMRTRCIDQLDKTEPPDLPTTYIYALVLRCLNSFSEGLAIFLLPFTAPAALKSKRKKRTSSKKNSRASKSDDDEAGQSDEASIQPADENSESDGQLLVNPLSLKNHHLYGQILTAASMVDHCWPALLAASSTFLDASLDSEYLHALIRSFQKFTQIAGLLDLPAPRDAFLTTLAKHAIPNSLAITSKFSATVHPDDSESDTNNDDVDSGREPIPTTFTPFEQQSKGSRRFTPVKVRNLLCLRALLNLGIALGPVLGESWKIVLETLHQVDIALITAAQSQNTKGRRHLSGESMDQKITSADTDDSELDTEKKSVDTAVSRLFQSTNDLSDQAFLHILGCLSSLIYKASRLPKRDEQFTKVDVSKSQSSASVTPKHHRFLSTPGNKMNTALTAKEVMLLLDRLAHIAMCNSSRLSQNAPSNSGWSMMVTIFIDHLSSPKASPEVRNRATSKLHDLILQVASKSSKASSEQRDNTICRCMEALATAASSIWHSNPTKVAEQCTLEVHSTVLETLTSLLEQSGDFIRSGWDAVFSIINSIFETDEQPLAEGKELLTGVSASSTRSSKLIRPSFTSMQLLCSDFLTSVPNKCFLTLLDTQYHFASQIQDLNVSLTSVNLFRNISDFLQRASPNPTGFAVDAGVAECQTHRDLIELIERQDCDVPVSAVWVCVLLRLGQLIRDSRAEVRHSALHTLFAIVDASSNDLSSEAWIMCFRHVFFKLLPAAESVRGRQSEGNVSQDSSRDDTACLLVQGLSKCFLQAQQTLSGHEDLAVVWNQLIGGYTELLNRRRLAVSRAVFSGLSDVLSVTGISFSTYGIPLDAAWAMWQDNNPSTYDLEGNMSKHDAMVAYLQYLQRIYGLLPRESMAGQAEAVMANLRLCIEESTAVPYGSDIDETTLVQKLVLEVMPLIPTSSAEILVGVAKEIAYLVTLAAPERDDRVQKGKSFVALSKTAMDALQGFMKQHCMNNDAPTAQLMSISLHALNTRIHVKYNRNHEGRGPPLWKTATLTAVSLLGPDLLRSCEGSLTDQQSMWSAIIDISDGVAGADTEACESSANIAADEQFDIENFSQLADIIIPALGSVSIPNQIRRKHVGSIFHHSLVHEPHPDDLARPDQELLDGLRSQHVGRVQDLAPTSRSKMSYVLLDHLFDLVAVHDGSLERIKLAQAAAPYLVLRAGLVLKAYICDQPLRGRMPQPLSQKREMHYVLERLVALDSEPAAFPETTSVRSERKRHLFLLYGLVMKALKASWRDREMSAALQKVLDTVGEDFGGF